MLSMLAVSGTLAAAGVALNGYRQNPRPEPGAPSGAAPAGTVRTASVKPGNAPADDPLAPRLFDQPGSIRVHMAGAVRHPGVYSLPAWARVVDGVKKAGGATGQANLDAINLADRLKDGEQVRIPVRGLAEPLDAHQPTPEPAAVPANVGGTGVGRYPFGPGSAASSGAQPAGPGQPVHLNSAGQQELERLPGVGPVTAAKILAFRTEYGPFARAEDLMNVPGIGPTRFEKLRPMVVAP
jgi:competence protein ComEA